MEEHWLRSSKEMNQWEILLEFGNSKGICNPHLVLDSVWRSPPNWQLMKDALNQVEVGYPKEMAWKINLYRGYLALCHPEESHLPSVERMAEAAQTLCIKVTKHSDYLKLNLKLL
jgi:transformation/transcription domain-associated protein